MNRLASANIPELMLRGQRQAPVCYFARGDIPARMRWAR